MRSSLENENRSSEVPDQFLESIEVKVSSLRTVLSLLVSSFEMLDVVPTI